MASAQKMTNTVISWLAVASSLCPMAEAGFPSRKTIANFRRVIDGRPPSDAKVNSEDGGVSHDSPFGNSLYRQSRHHLPSNVLDSGSRDKPSTTQSHPVVSLSVLSHLDVFPVIVDLENNDECATFENSEPFDETRTNQGTAGQQNINNDGDDDGDVPVSDDFDDDGDMNEEGCTAMAMKKHNAVGDDPSDNDASDSDEDDEDELSMEFSDAELEELAGEALSQAAAAAQSFLNNRPLQQPKVDKDAADDDNRIGDVRTGHLGDDQFSEEDEDDIDQVNIDMDIVLSNERSDAVHGSDVGTEENDNRATSDEDSDRDYSTMTIDDLLLKAIQTQVFFPPTAEQIMEIAQQQKSDDSFSKKNGLDRRTFYRSLLLELIGEIDADVHNKKERTEEHNKKQIRQTARRKSGSSKKSSATKTSKRKFLDEQTVARQLRSTLSLATQPKWRHHMMRIAHRHVHGTDLIVPEGSTVGTGSGLKLYADEDGGSSSFHSNKQNAIFASCSMQETLLLSLAHSLQCGMVTLDDNFFTSVRKVMAANARKPGVHISKEEIAEIKNGDILDALFTFANSGALRDSSFTTGTTRKGGFAGAKLSTKMKGDFVAWEVHASEGSKKSLEAQLEFESKNKNDTRVESGSIEENDKSQQETESNLVVSEHDVDRRPLPLVVYLRADPSLMKDEMDLLDSDSIHSTSLSSQKIFQSKSSMDRLLAELKYPNSIHLICLGKECDFDTVGEIIRSDGKSEGQQQQQGSSGMDLESKSGGGGFGGMFGGNPTNFGGQNPFNSLSPGPQKPGLPGMSPGTTNPFLQAMQNAFASAGYRTNNRNNSNGSGNPNAGNGINPNPMMPPPGMIGQNHPHPMFNGGFGPNNNASGANDPEGSQRFNIFLARTVDETGNPGIMGAVAPPAAGNVFPLMFSMMQQKQRQQQQQGNSGTNDGDAKNNNNGNSNSFQIPPMPPWGVPHSPSSTWQTNPLPGMQIPTGAQFFNASIHISGMTMNRNDDTNGAEDDSNSNDNKEANVNNSWGNNAPPPELLQKAMEMAMTQVVERLADANTGASGNGGSNNNNNNPHTQNIQGNLPPQLAKAFSTILANEQLRRGIAENLARAAPALLDPRCQGVMLSVYVPPGPDHPNRGQMPGGVNGGMNTGTITTSASVNPSATQGVPSSSSSSSSGDAQGGSNSSHGGSKGSWFQKILSSPVISSESTSSADNHKEESDGVPEADKETSMIDDQNKRAKMERKAAKRLLNFKSRSKRSSAEDDGIEDKDLGTTSDVEEGHEDDVDLEGKDDDANTSTITKSSSPSNPSVSDGEKSKKKQAARSAQSAIMKRSRNIRNLEALCHTSVPLTTPNDPIKKKLWNGWLIRQCNARCFRKNKAKLEEMLMASGLYVATDNNEDGDGDGGNSGPTNLIRPLREISPTLQAMLSVKDCTEDMTEVIRVAVEIEAERTLRNMERQTGVHSAMDYEPVDNDYHEEHGSSDSSTPIHSSSIESALALVCRVTPHSSGSSDGTSGGAYGVSSSSSPKRSREDLMQAASDKHERALCQNIIFPEHIGVTYDQIGGLDEVKELLRQSITYPLKYPSLYSEGIARESCKGVLLFGPPGTGKTMLAKAVATEGGATFLSVDASSVENKWLGESEKNAKAVFTLARRLAPCVIFLDEVDSLLSSREGTGDDSAHGTLTSVKTTMMSEWDGLNSGTNGEHAPRVIVIGSTNRPFDLDEAVLRRFPRRILVDLPDLDTRREILEVTMAENRVEPSVNFTSIAERLEGYTGSDIKEVCREAVVRISHEQAKMLDRGLWSSSSSEDNTNESKSSSGGGATLTGLQRLRPVTMDDFEVAMSKLKRSVSEKGRELARVWEWNDEYGEIKRKDRTDALPQLMNMFL